MHSPPGTCYTVLAVKEENRGGEGEKNRLRQTNQNLFRIPLCSATLQDTTSLRVPCACTNDPKTTDCPDECVLKDV